jgi:integrase
VAVRVAGDPDTMHLQEHSNRDDLKVWLSQDEVNRLLDTTADTQQRIAIALGVRCGLRSHEVLDVAPEHLVDTDAGTMLRVWHGKGEQFRETPIPQELATTIRTVADVRDAPDSSSLLDVTTTRSLRRWLRTAADQLHEDTGDEGWTQLGFHDLRRTWATALAAADVDPLLVCDWGGWNDLETFLEHYRGTYSPEAQLRERDKVSWL